MIYFSEHLITKNMSSGSRGNTAYKEHALNTVDLNSIPYTLYGPKKFARYDL